MPPARRARRSAASLFSWASAAAAAASSVADAGGAPGGGGGCAVGTTRPAPGPKPESCLARNAARASASDDDGGGMPLPSAATVRPPGTSTVSMVWMTPLEAPTSVCQLPPERPISALSSQFLRRRRSYLSVPPSSVSWSEVSASIDLRPGRIWYLRSSGVIGTLVLSKAASDGTRTVNSPDERSMPFACSAAANCPNPWSDAMVSTMDVVPTCMTTGNARDRMAGAMSDLLRRPAERAAPLTAAGRVIAMASTCGLRSVHGCKRRPADMDVSGDDGRALNAKITMGASMVARRRARDSVMSEAQEDFSIFLSWLTSALEMRRCRVSRCVVEAPAVNVSRSSILASKLKTHTAQN